ncbi:MAG: hypothetical protein F4X97_02030 [Boseongicola sp. SB0662_bin_57]|nr:hypothetical protein [Boseongicola sp. SB0662_bin_57]
MVDTHLLDKDEVIERIKYLFAQQVLDEIKEYIQADMFGLDKVVTGEAFDSWEIIKDTDGNWSLYSGSAGMYHVEFGRQPNSRPPPPDVIAQWLYNKVGLDEEEAKKLSVKISLDIGKNGIPETRIVRDTLASLEGDA